MWYVIQVVSGQERVIKRWIDRTGMANDCFIPLRERKRKYQGSWKLVKEKIFPGYLFVVTEYPELLLESLRKIPRFTRMLGMAEGKFIALNKREIHFISRFGDENHVSHPSFVEIEPGNHVRIISGNLLDYEGEIVSYNLHKQTATVRVPFMGRTVNVYLGIEMIEQTATGEEDKNKI